jgi:DNA-binding FadR family transcriptional regulator
MPRHGIIRSTAAGCYGNEVAWMTVTTRSRLPGRMTLTSQLLESLGQAIVSGEFDGEKFPSEAEISKRHRTSRSVTREAVKMLTAKGMISTRPRSGIVTQPQERWSLLDPDVLRWMLERKFSYELLRHFTEMRLGLETAAAALAAKYATPQTLRGIEIGLGRMVAAGRGDGDHLAADIAFHVAILEATENPFYLQLDEFIHTALKFSIRLTNRIKGSPSIPAHRRVFDAIKSGDAEKASSAMAQIITEALALISAAERKDRKSKRPARSR